MFDYKSNTDKDKQAEEQNETKRKDIKPVVKGETQIYKKSYLNKMLHAFIAEDIENLPNVIFSEIIGPSIKRSLLDIGIDTCYRIFGDGVLPPRSSRSRTEYGRCYTTDIVRPKNTSDAMNSISLQDYRGDVQPYNTVAFIYRPDAETVLESMLEAISVYGSVSVADYYEWGGVPNDNYTLNNYGWTDLSTARITQVRDGRYILKLPKAIQLRQR